MTNGIISLDDIARIYSEDTGFDNILMNYKILEISKYCRGDIMLDVGCGIGILTKALSSNFKQVIGIDGSSIKIEKAKINNYISNIEYINSLFEDYKFKIKFDFIVATNILEHVDNPVFFLKSIKNMLSPEGRLVLTVPNALGLHKRIGKIIGLIDDFYHLTKSDILKGHKRIYDGNALRNDIESAGLVIEHIGGLFLKPLSNEQMESWDPLLIDALFQIGKELPEYCSSIIAVVTS